jgi:hypothetical protein
MNFRFRSLPAVLAVALLLCVSYGLPPRASADDPFHTTPNPGGGSITTGSVGSTSLPATAGALMRSVRAELGVRPTIVQALQNAHDHSLTLLFTAARAGTPYTGIAIVTAPPGEKAGGAALYDTAARFRTTVGPMMRRLDGMTTPPTPGSARVPVALAPPEPLAAQPFTDGTGSISVPSGWAVPVANGGSVLASSPSHDVQVAYNMHFTGVDPSSPRAQMWLRTASPLARQGLHGAVLPYTTDAEKAWVAMFTELGREHGVQSAINVSSSSSGPSGSDFSGTFGSGPKMVHFIVHAFVLPPNPLGMWGLSDSHIFVNDASFARLANTANAVLGSVRINFGAVAAEQDGIRKAFQSQFEAEIRNDQEEDAMRQRGTDEALAHDRAAQEGMHRQAVSMENYSLDRAVVVNTTTGRHDTVDSDFADELVHDNANYEKVPAANLLRGVDY